LSVLTQPLRFERYLEETGGLMTMALPFRQKAMVKMPESFQKVAKKS
jgi:hypothetical protein